MTSEPLTTVQHRILDFTKRYIRENELSPLLREIGEHFSVSRPTVYGHLRELERKGRISVARGVSRGISIVGYDAERKARYTAFEEGMAHERNCFIYGEENGIRVPRVNPYLPQGEA